MDYGDNDVLSSDEHLENWVMAKCNSWRDHYESNYAERFEEFYRLWRGIWAAEDMERKSERSRIISPALQQAVESSVAEIEEATFGRGKYFDITDELGDAESQDVVYLRTKLHEDFEKTQIRKQVGECLINSAVFGMGVAEVVLEEVKEMAPATQPLMDGQLQAVGVNVTDRTVVKLRPVLPQNFLIDPVATSIQDAIGVAVDEFVPRHKVQQLQEEGVYRDVYVGQAASDYDLEPDQDLTSYDEDKVRLTKYYGLVPRYLLEIGEKEAMLNDDEDIADIEVEEPEKDEDESYYVEAIVVVANGGILLKAEANPYMMQDRPVVAFPWDVVPGRFWGRGVCEKGYNSQKALDTELRARIDALALTVHPMMAMDATRLPRGSRPEVRPGKIILTNGDPKNVLNPFNFGQVSQITFAQAAELQKMVQMSTGAIDSAGIPGSINGDATAAGISMSLGAIIKRHKRTLINFQQSFLIPFVKMAACRYMQFDPENYPVKDYKFNTTSTLGIIAREYEVTQLVQLLQTMSQDSPLYNTLIQSIIDNMNLSNREELMAKLAQAEQASQPTEEQQQAQQAAVQAQMAFQQSQTAALNGQAQESSARAQKIAVETQLAPQELQIDQIKAVTANLKAGDQEDKEFERRMKIAQTFLKEKEIELKNQPLRLQQG
ncbi:MAG: hypothetical protein CBD88_07330 [Flavobacteriales bacterium TMED228]|nr:MAG: hypothetical protein CBD88_07330 [Flavobacteriales bacterium TMED228]|tara:strand:+ start:13570 stop:15555 length:1986 start_codon:yes stop_codon:yes gene_type:complete